MPRVIIDPGHGGRDPGAIGKTTHEKNNNLKLALNVGKILQQHGVSVHYTRTTDKDFCSGAFDVNKDLENRIAVAKQFYADVFASLHNNAFNKLEKGLETYCFKFGGNDERLARCIQDQMAFNPALGMLNRGVKASNYYVLKRYDKTNTSACLVEYGFIDSEEDAILAKMDIAAESIAKGILKFLDIDYKGVKDVLDHAVVYFTDRDFSSARIVSDKLGGCAMFCRNGKPTIHPAAKASKHPVIIGGPELKDHPNVTNCCGIGAPETAILAAQYAQKL